MEELKSWSDNILDQVWNKAFPILGKDPAFLRRDECGAPIQRNMHGGRMFARCWEVHHKDANPDNDQLDNLIPLQWENNLARKDIPYSKTCKVTS